MKLHTPVRLSDHIIHKSGKHKTVCVTACLTALGVPVDSFNCTGSLSKPNYLSILGRNGLSYRSRKSSVSNTIGAAKRDIASKLTDQNGYYFVVVHGSGYCHAMLLDTKGKVVVDTAPRKRDRRKIHSIHFVSK